MLAILLVVLALLRGMGFGQFDVTVLGYILLGIGVYFLDEFQKISIGKDGLSLERRAEQAIEDHGVGGRPDKVQSSGAAPQMIRELNSKLDDPNKGQFGGSPIQNNKRMWASVVPYSKSREWFFVRIVVESSNPLEPLTGEVTFFLHPSFKTPQVNKPVTDGQAVLETVAWGAFTVGAICQADDTRLELDLSELPTAPSQFRAR